MGPASPWGGLIQLFFSIVEKSKIFFLLGENRFSEYIPAFLPKNLLLASSVITKYGVLYITLLLIKTIISKKVQQWIHAHGINWYSHIPHHPGAAGLVERFNGLLKVWYQLRDDILKRQFFFKRYRLYVES